MVQPQITDLVIVQVRLRVSQFGVLQLEMTLRHPRTRKEFRCWWSLDPASRAFARTVREAEILGLDIRRADFEWESLESELNEYGHPTASSVLVGRTVRAEIDPTPRRYNKVRQLLPSWYTPPEMSGALPSQQSRSRSGSSAEDGREEKTEPPRPPPPPPPPSSGQPVVNFDPNPKPYEPM